jgi:hypothetical protein
LAIERADAPDDQPSAVEFGLGDLCDRGGRVVVKRRPRALVDRLDRRADLRLEADADRELPAGAVEPVEGLVRPEPESARSSFGPVAPARSARAMSTSQKRSMPREVFADPFLRRTCSTSPVSARVAISGW